MAMFFLPAVVGQAPPPEAETDTTQTANEPQSRRNIRQLIHVFSDGELKANEECQEAAFIFSSGTIDGIVQREAICVFGSLTINGTVEREVWVVFGKLTIGPTAVLKSDVRIIGGELVQSPEANVARKPEMIAPGLADLGAWFRHGFVLGRPLPPSVTWVWWVAAAFLLVYVMTLSLFPKPVESCVQALELRPVGSFFSGLLLLALLGAALLGKTAVLRFTGQQLARQLGAGAAPKPLLALLGGAVVFCLFYMIPVLGFIVWSAALLMALGAAVLAATQGLRRESGNEMPLAEGPPRVRLQAPGAAVADAASPARTAEEELGLPHAGFWLRFLALALDVFLFFCVTFVISLVARGKLPGAMGPILLLLWGTYHVGLWTWKGTTIGGIVVGLKLVRIDGRPVDLPVALVRALSSLFSGMALGLGFFWAGWSREKLAWHDRIAGTVIVKVPRGTALL
jgi:uncharacterized RDD family membrane protein YckC